jgi:hypothetical protein
MPMGEKCILGHRGADQSGKVCACFKWTNGQRTLKQTAKLPCAIGCVDLRYLRVVKSSVFIVD